MRVARFLRWVSLIAIAMTAWLASAKNVWAADAPLCHHHGGSAQGREAVLIGDDVTMDFEDPDASIDHDKRLPTPPEERVTDKADPAIVTGWTWFPRAPVSLVHFLYQRASGCEGVARGLERPPRA